LLFGAPEFSSMRFFVLLFLMLPLGSSAAGSPTSLVYFGTYTRADSKGIYVGRFDHATGALTKPELVATVGNPTFLALHPRLPILYAIGDSPQPNGSKATIVNAYAIEASGRLTLLNQLLNSDANACYITVHPDGRRLYTAHYAGGFVAAYSLADDGRLLDRTNVVKHQGTGPHKQQDAPHAHCIDVAPTGRLAFSADLGADKIFAYRLDAANSLEPHTPYVAATALPGAGPRHLAFHPNGRFLYSINELDATVTVFAYDSAGGTLKEIETVSATPADFNGRRWGAEVVIHPSGKFLYASNRADHESLAVFAIDAASGRLTATQHVTGVVKHPRHFALDREGRWLLCGNHDADTVSILRVDTATGQLTPHGSPVAVPNAVCVLFYTR
jgi:6-phosphogluconolactonase